MPFIKLATFIHAKPQIVFDLSRSIDLHQTSMGHTNEKAIGGITTGLINEGETVIWTAKHFFKTRMLKVQITQMKPYEFFEDEMLEGDFKSMKHKHIFRAEGSGTKMIDEFSFEAPYGFIGKFFNYIFLTAYMKALLMQRNCVIKEFAETEKRKTVLPQTHI
ncbi:MAG TPA: SRPBCC family protein [Panacibacter sp.]|nr:SRPBCC family protein [Panacibacter sp.]